MKNTRLMRLLITMIAALMVLGCLLTSCTDNTKDPNGTETTGGQGNDPTNPEDPEDTSGEEEVDEYEALRGLDFGNKEFKVFTYPTSSGWAQYFQEHEGGVERLNEASVDRNGVVEELLNVAIVIEPSVGARTVTSEYIVMAMGSSADVPETVIPFATEGIMSLMVGGYLYDVSELDHMNLENEYYNQSARRNFNFKGIQYAFVSDYTYAVQQRFAFLANIDMIEEWGALEMLETDADSFYELVTEGEFTVENMLKMIEGVYQDNGSEDPLEQTFGFVTNSNSAGRMFQDWGEPLISLDDDGQLVFDLYDDIIEAKFSKLNELVYSTYSWYDTIGNNSYYKIFNKGNAMFSTYSSDPYAFVNTPWADVHFSYGPMPKYSADDDYVTIAHGGLILIPSKIAEPEMVGAVNEALAIASREFIKDEYIANYFETRIIQDPEGIELYEILRETAYYDFARYCDPSGKLSGAQYITKPLGDKTALSTYHQNNGDGVKTAFNNLFKQLESKK